MKRRSFIGYTSLATLTVFIPIYSCVSKSNKTIAIELPSSLLNILTTDGILELGKIYLKTFPNESNSELLKTLILQNEDQTSKDKHKNKSEIELEIKDDFIRGNMVILEGWVLSKTEARQCALYSLLQ